MAESPGYPNLIAARSTADEKPTDLAMEPGSRSLYVAPWTWNTTLLAWEKIADINSKFDQITELLKTVTGTDVTGHTSWSKIGYAPMPATTETDLWSYGGTTAVIPLMTTEATRRVVTANAADAGTVIKGDATTDTVTSDADGTSTTLVDADVDFGAATAVAAGDCVILDPHGASPEWGYVTTVATHTLTLENGFSLGGSGASRKYAVIDYSNQVGCHAVLTNYLDANYVSRKEIVVTNGNVANGVLTINSNYYRINSFRVIATGSAGFPTGAIILGDNATPPTIIYTYITAGKTRARNSIYTVPANKILYVMEWNVSFAANTSNKTDNCRIYTRAAQYTNESGDALFRTNVAPGVVIWYPYTETVCANSNASITFPIPIKILPKVSLKVSGAATAAGVAESVLRGRLETYP